jgi:hypothetical protein
LNVADCKERVELDRKLQSELVSQLSYLLGCRALTNVTC